MSAGQITFDPPGADLGKITCGVLYAERQGGAIVLGTWDANGFHPFTGQQQPWQWPTREGEWSDE